MHATIELYKEYGDFVIMTLFTFILIPSGQLHRFQHCDSLKDFIRLN